MKSLELQLFANTSSLFMVSGVERGLLGFHGKCFYPPSYLYGSLEQRFTKSRLALSSVCNKVDLELMPPPPKCQDYRPGPSHPVYGVLRIKPRASLTLGNHSPTGLHLQPMNPCFYKCLVGLLDFSGVLNPAVDFTEKVLLHAAHRSTGLP